MENSLSILRTVLFCVRGVLWICVAVGSLLLFSFLDNHGHPYVGLLIVFLGILASIYLIGWQLAKDITKVKEDYIYGIYKKVCNELLHQDSNILPILDKELPEPTSKEYFWIKDDGQRYDNLKSYLDLYQYRNDSNGLSMQSASSKSKMREILLTVRHNVHSIRIWHEQALVSINYSSPITFSNVVKVGLVNNPIHKRGRAVTTSKTSYRGRSRPSLLTNQRKYRGSQTHESITTYEPDRILDDYKLYLIVNDGILKNYTLHIGYDGDLAHELEAEFLNMMNSGRHNDIIGIDNMPYIN